jgi:hypothetical protein
MKESSQSINAIIRAAKTPEEQTATLTALREHLATLTDEKAKKDLSQNALSSLADNIGESGFDAGTKWVAQADFTPAELESFTSGLYGSTKSEENGKWIEWIGEKLPAKKAAENINNLVRNWTRNDYQAAGKWLSTAAAGPAKNSAIRSYAETVAEYEPATATQWALTLPAGKDRDNTLEHIYENWPKNDATAKEAFKLEHGIK